MPAGRPLKYKTVNDLQKLIDSYFESCFEITTDKNGKEIKEQVRPFTVTGLALHLDSSREVLLNYQERPEFADAIRKAKLKCHNFAEESLWKPKIAQGMIFSLKNNYGWKDKSETDVNQTSLNVNLNSDIDVDKLTEEEVDKLLKDKLRK